MDGEEATQDDVARHLDGPQRPTFWHHYGHDYKHPAHDTTAPPTLDTHFHNPNSPHWLYIFSFFFFLLILSRIYLLSAIITQWHWTVVISPYMSMRFHSIRLDSTQVYFSFLTLLLLDVELFKLFFEDQSQWIVKCCRSLAGKSAMNRPWHPFHVWLNYWSWWIADEKKTTKTPMTPRWHSGRVFYATTTDAFVASSAQTIAGVRHPSIWSSTFSSSSRLPPPAHCTSSSRRTMHSVAAHQWCWNELNQSSVLCYWCHSYRRWWFLF